MVCPKAVGCMVRCVGEAALFAALACCLAAQTSDFTQRLAEGQTLRVHDRYAEARTVFLSMLRDLRQSEPNDRIEGLVDDNLALVEQDLGDYAAAETAFNHGLNALRAELPYDPETIAIEAHLGELYLAEIRPRDAEALLRRSLEDAHRSPKAASMQLSVLNEDLAVACILRKKFSESEPLLREAEVLMENEYGPNDPRLSSSLLSYSGLLVAQHRYGEAVAPAERAWQILSHTAVLIPKSYQASALNVLGAVYFHVGRLNEARQCAHRSVELATEALGAEHPRLALYLSNYALILKTAGQKNEAKAAQKHADEIMEKFPLDGSGGYTVNVASLR